MTTETRKRRNYTEDFKRGTVALVTNRAGVLDKDSNGKYSVPNCIARYIAFRLESAAASSESIDVTEARARLYKIQTHKTELETDKTWRETILAFEHITDMRELQRIFSAALDGIDDTLAEDIADLTDATAISDRLTLATHSIRESVADSLTEYAATVDAA